MMTVTFLVDCFLITIARVETFGNLLSTRVHQCTEAITAVEEGPVKTHIHVRVKVTRLNARKCDVAFVKKRVICVQSSGSKNY